MTEEQDRVASEDMAKSMMKISFLRLFDNFFLADDSLLERGKNKLANIGSVSQDSSLKLVSRGSSLKEGRDYRPLSEDSVNLAKGFLTDLTQIPIDWPHSSRHFHLGIFRNRKFGVSQ